MDDEEAYILLLLSDSNLPTGAFVASAGLESYVAHGFFQRIPSTSTGMQSEVDPSIDFLRNSLATYAHSALPFVSDTHEIVDAFLALPSDDFSADTSADTLNHIKALDDLYEAMTLNHVTRRASKSQGVALLTLYAKGFSKPPHFQVDLSTSSGLQTQRTDRAAKLVEKLKLDVRREKSHGHLPICWAVLTSCLGLSLGAIRSLLSPVIPIMLSLSFL
ncbi:uncharacterized protein FIBRA_00587 [Fibroporia radiculosa]|uniref:Uncharacterized protein n=1 Tax=Fibroporia radiculosa TaxID=599839 RepID=J4I808_9APHY|nr:uncharacterized protein FIBRA_00587 [Fibroporia radiculosa]CCL98586.1 predicted protein [Fibroporia radiculosa]